MHSTSLVITHNKICENPTEINTKQHYFACSCSGRNLNLVMTLNELFFLISSWFNSFSLISLRCVKNIQKCSFMPCEYRIFPNSCNLKSIKNIYYYFHHKYKVTGNSKYIRQEVTSIVTNLVKDILVLRAIFERNFILNICIETIEEW